MCTYHTLNSISLLQVSYQVDGFIDKNKDLLYRDLSQLMFNCERKLLKNFFPEGITIS